MDVELPNGTVIQGVPEGTSKEEIMRKAIGAGLATEADFAAPAPESQAEQASPQEQPQQAPQQVQASENSGEPEWQRVLRNAGPVVASDIIAAVASGVGGQIVGGLRGIYEASQNGAAAGADAVDETVEGMSYQPKTEVGQAGLEALSAVGPYWEKLQNLMGTGAEEMGRMVGIEPGTEEAAKLYALGSAMPDAVGMLVPAGKAKPTAAPEAAASAAARNAESIGRSVEQAANSGFGKKAKADRAAAQIAEDVRPQQEVVGAFESVGMPAESVPPEVLSGNQAFREVAGTARSVPGSELSQRYRVFMEDLSRRADELSRAADADDIGTINARVEEGIAGKIEKARQIESELYQKVDDAVAPATPVDVTPITDALRARIDEVGGDLGELSAMERRLVGRFMTRAKQADGTITYTDKPKTWSGITGLRKEINAARGGKGGFGDAASYELEKYGNLVSSTQRGIADGLGVGEDYAAAMKATGIKKAAQEASQKLLGKQLDKSFSAMFEGKVKELAKGRVKEFQEAVEAIPAGQRQQAVTSFVYDQIIDRRNMDPRANIAKYNAFYNQLQSNPAAKTALYRNLPKQARQDIDALGKITSAVKRANEDKIVTGRLQTADQGFKLGESIVGKVANALYVTGGGMAGGVVGGPLGSAAGSAAGAAMSATKAPTKLNVAASEVLASPGFQRHVINVVRGEGAGRLKASERGLANTPAWKAYVASLPERSQRDIARMGITGWLSAADEAASQEASQTSR